jgi:nitrate/TMAO reductase-like tetraheme cytochrome c subunit
MGAVFSPLVRIILVLILSAVPIAAQDSPFQKDPVEEYAALSLQALLVVGIAIVSYSLFRYRGRIQGTVSWLALITGVAVIPLVTGLVGTIVVLERAEQVQFCASCHLTMKPYVDDLKNDASNSLAAVHYKNRYIASNQCYECHTSYGLHGTVEAKISGMVDTFKYYTGTYQLPIRMRNAYRNDDCLKCHAQSAKWEPLHQDVREALFTGQMTCMECHNEKNPAHNLTSKVAGR